MRTWQKRRSIAAVTTTIWLMTTARIRREDNHHETQFHSTRLRLAVHLLRHPAALRSSFLSLPPPLVFLTATTPTTKAPPTHQMLRLFIWKRPLQTVLRRCRQSHLS